ncbi:MAG: hypothetical protein ABSB33_04020 [Tepidisphaeraceae bacterium]
MIGLPTLGELDRAAAVWIWLAVAPADMRCGFDRLAELALAHVLPSEAVHGSETALSISPWVLIEKNKTSVFRKLSCFMVRQSYNECCRERQMNLGSRRISKSFG